MGTEVVAMPAGVSIRRLGRLAAAVSVLSMLFAALFVGSSGSAGDASRPIALVRNSDGVYVMREDGSGLRLVRRTGLWTEWVTWSPDGRRLAYVVHGANGGLWVMGADGSDPVRLFGGAGSLSRPTWSPDGQRIAFALSRESDSDIWVVNADGRNLRRLTTARLGRLWAPDWSPDGRRLVLVRHSPSPGIPGIYVVDLSGDGLRRLAAIGGWQDSPAPDWSPDGRRIAFVDTAVSPGAASRSASSDEIWVMDADGGSKVQLTSNHVPDHDPVWSPDGGRIAFVGAFAGAGSSRVYVIGADGTGFTKLTRGSFPSGSPSWRPAAVS